MKKAVSKKAKEPIRLRSKKLSNGNLSLYLDLYRDGKREYEFLKMYLIPERTKSDKIQNEETLRTANAIKAQKVISLQNEEHGFKTSTKAKVNFIHYLESQAENYEAKGGVAYARTIRNTIYHLAKYKGFNISLSQVNKPYLKGFIDFLNTTEGKFNRKLSEAAQSLYFQVVVIALNKAVKDGILITNPAHKISKNDRPKQGEATKEYLTFDEVRALAVTPCKNEMLKRAFLFCCFCGLRYSDVIRLKWVHVHKIKKGSYQVEIKQQKTGETLYLPLSENALTWLPDRGNASDNEHIFILQNISTVERQLKVWAADAKIDKHVTFHVSRHTNATLMLYFGADIYTVSKLLGHTNVKTTQIYAKIVDESKRKAVNLIPDITL